MSVQSAESITVEFTTRNFSTGVGVNADSLPTGILVVNGVDNAAVVTVTNVGTGRYKAQVTLPTLAVSDVVELVASATVATIADKAVIWRDSKDTVILADGVSHGGTLGSSTATLALKTANITNPAGDALYLQATGGRGMQIYSTNNDGLIVISDTANAFAVFGEVGISIVTSNGPGIDVNATNGSGMALAGDPAFFDLSAPNNDLGAATLNLANGIETGYTLKQSLRLILAALAGKISGAGTTTVHIRDVNDTVDRILATVDSFGNRSAVTLTP